MQYYQRVEHVFTPTGTNMFSSCTHVCAFESFILNIIKASITHFLPKSKWFLINNSGDQGLHSVTKCLAHVTRVINGNEDPGEHE